MMRHQGLERRGVVPGDESLQQLSIAESRDGPVRHEAFDLTQCGAQCRYGHASRSPRTIVSLHLRDWSEDRSAIFFALGMVLASRKPSTVSRVLGTKRSRMAEGTSIEGYMHEITQACRSP